VSDVWSALVGQDDAVRVLREAARAAGDVVAGREVPPGAVAHAWLFTGPAGSGRSVAARAFAAALQCERVSDPGCGECSGCHTVLVGTHPDVRLIVPEGLSISVNETREIVQKAARLPSQDRWQVVVIEDADRMGERASNALLKAIEEPSARTVFLLCTPSTHPDDIPVTIRSRCRLIALRTPAAAAVAAVLAADGIEAGMAEWAAAAGQGHVGVSRRLARDGDARERRAAVLEIPASLTSIGACMSAADHLVSTAKAEAAVRAAELDGAETEAMQNALGVGATGRGAAASTRRAAGVLKDLEKKQKSRATRTVRDALDRALVDLAAFYRDVLLEQSGSAVARAHPDFAAAEQAVAACVSPAGALRRLEAVLECREALELNVKPEIAVEALTARLRLP
jgi:DNA polymerase-3 subunit delta'